MTLEPLKHKIENEGRKCRTTSDAIEKIKTCKVCLASNATQRPHNAETLRKAIRPLERIHMDTLGPIPTQTFRSGS
ncbi:uncharacterized protein J8A68_001567 [[Candida] subhashii]|uniref:Uncharacterized protein n=1 Tax=[Candida] subhashii TaxID=561895 RepID=A0A8J5QNR7_9ASCO|nr:uncharacterized protein J8A68_001567 [[Candida] subhashii]KAG7664929.1 hypothetical protein J8A68_001567 [[Candida] subhashii]